VFTKVATGAVEAVLDIVTPCVNTSFR